MNKDSTDFMLEEYNHIANAYFGLRDQINEWFKSYITLIGLPLTILAAAQKIAGGTLDISISNLPNVVSALLILVSILGLFVTVSIVSMRMEMILYARTINDVRRYFVELDNRVTEKNHKLIDYLILPTSDKKPPFFEAWRAMFWQVLMIGLIDGLVFSVAINSLTKIQLIWIMVIGLVILFLHFFIYWILARKRENKWNVHFEDNLKTPNL